MKALVYTGPNALEWRDEPEPTLGDHEVLVRVEAVGICGSDMHAYHGHDSRRPPPLVLGHEAAGRIVGGPNDGRPVAVNPLVACGACDFCEGGRPHLCPSREILSMPPRPGAFAEFVRAPERNAVVLPDGLDAAEAALTEPLAVSYHAVLQGARLLGRTLAASRCAVLGGGAIGLGCALVLAWQGAQNIAIGEPNEGRRRTAARAGPFRCYEPKGRDSPADGSVDLVIDAVGAVSTRAAASRLVRPGGAIVHVGLLPGSEGLDVRRPLMLSRAAVSAPSTGTRSARCPPARGRSAT
jgi:threonine dehydrogenase-like Zn-dependent dehydrogenase